MAEIGTRPETSTLPAFQLEACPHCGVKAEVSTHAVYRYQCRVCGSPRIPVNGRVTHTPPQIAQLLKRVRTRHIARGAWKAAANTLWLMAILAGLLGLGLAATFDFQTVGISLVTLLTALPVLIGVFCRHASGRAAAESKEALGQAWSTMAAHVFVLLGGKATVDDFKAVFGVDTDSAVALFAEAEVAQLLDPTINHSATSGDGPKVRVASPATEEELEQQALADLRKELGHK